jgi:putative Ca2+/H+ antiporter (TMEM165/GDT1 family)
MDAVLLALLLGLALDQGDRSQRLARSLSPRALWPVCVIVLIGALVSSLLGLAIAPYLRGPAGLLFFAIAIVLGAIGLLMPGGSSGPVDDLPSPRLKLYGQLLLHRLGDRSSFLLVGVSAMTGNGWATAIGGALGGLGALLPPLLAGAAYEKALPMRVIRPLLGALLFLAGLGCGLSALDLL